MDEHVWDGHTAWAIDTASLRTDVLILANGRKELSVKTYTP